MATMESRLRTMTSGTPSTRVASKHRGVTMFLKSKKANEIAEISLDTTVSPPVINVEKVK